MNKRIMNKNNIQYMDIADIVNWYNTDCVITDKWVSNFLKNLDRDYENYNKLREELIDNVKFWSMHEPTLKHKNFNKLKSLGNIYLNLIHNPDWVDILLASSIERADVDEDSIGRFDRLKEIYIKKISKIFDGQ